MNWINRFNGRLLAEAVSADPENLLRMLQDSSITVWDVQRLDDLTLRFMIRSKDYDKLLERMEAKGESLRILRPIGVVWSVTGIFQRPVLIAGILLVLLLTLLLPRRVLFIRVEGNESIPTRQILASAENCGLRFFASRAQVRSEALKNAMLLEIPQLQWVGINTKGCTATISVREKTQSEKQQSTGAIGHVVALRDGLVDSVIVSEGTALCVPGQVVKQGQILISGYTDCGICIRAAAADGEIYALTHRSVSAVSPSGCLIFQPDGRVKQKISLIIGKKRINLWKDSGIWDASCGRMYSEYYITLPGGFTLPVAIGVDTYTPGSLTEFAVPLPEMQSQLTSFARTQILQDMIAGQILRPSEAFSEETGCTVLSGKYLCREMIGRILWEQIGE